MILLFTYYICVCETVYSPINKQQIVSEKKNTHTMIRIRYVQSTQRQVSNYLWRVGVCRATKSEINTKFKRKNKNNQYCLSKGKQLWWFRQKYCTTLFFHYNIFGAIKSATNYFRIIIFIWRNHRTNSRRFGVQFMHFVIQFFFVFQFFLVFIFILFSFCFYFFQMYFFNILFSIYEKELHVFSECFNLVRCKVSDFWP